MPPNGGKLHNIINSGYKDECMNNQYAVLISSEIPELGELDLLRSIYRELNGYMEDYNNQINLDDLGDWKLLIQINLVLIPLLFLESQHPSRGGNYRPSLVRQ